jgi:hypothetical protein
MLEWAKREVEIASKRERGDKPEDEWDYGVACYEGALEAFEVLCKQGHSGMSIGITKQILNRLIDGKPLTPIEDTEDAWNDISRYGGGLHYQCKRMSGLFKNVDEHGNISYTDVNSSYCIDIDTGATYHSRLVRKVVDTLYPIRMPYIPADKPIKVYCETFLVDPTNGDWDTKGILYLEEPDGKRVEVNIFYAELGGEMVRITVREYKRRKRLARRRILEGGVV